MADPLVFTSGTTTASLTRAIKVTKVVLIQTTATQAASATVADLNGNLFIPALAIPTSLAANSVAVQDYAVPKILPGGALVPAGGTIPNFVVTVTGAGASLYLNFR